MTITSIISVTGHKAVAYTYNCFLLPIFCPPPVITSAALGILPGVTKQILHPWRDWAIYNPALNGLL